MSRPLDSQFVFSLDNSPSDGWLLMSSSFSRVALYRFANLRHSDFYDWSFVGSGCDSSTSGVWQMEAGHQYRLHGSKEREKKGEKRNGASFRHADQAATQERKCKPTESELPWCSGAAELRAGWRWKVKWCELLWKREARCSDSSGVLGWNDRKNMYK